MNLIEKAARVAIRAHEGQVRKGDGFPYIIHPFMVAAKLVRHGFSDEVVAAALVHDVLEDTDMSEEDMREELGDEVVDMVVVLSEDKSLPWEARKERYIEVLRGVPEEVKAISAADKIHNIESMLDAHARKGSALWESFSRDHGQQLWFAERHLAMLKETWQHPLLSEYESSVRKLQNLTP